MSDQAVDEAVSTIKEAGVKIALIETQAPDRLVRALEDKGLAVARIDTLTAHTEADFGVYARVMRANAQAFLSAASRAS